MREYCLIYYAWGHKCKVPTVMARLLYSNMKRQMTVEDGLLFIRLMKRKVNRRKHGRRSHV